MCETFGVMPWDMERLTIRTFVHMVDTIEARIAAAEKAEREARARG